MMAGSVKTSSKGKVSTDTLAKRVMRTKKLEQFIRDNEAFMENISLPEYLERLMNERGLSAAEVIRRSQIERSYGYQIFRGDRRPSRDRLLMLALGLGLNVEETGRLLMIGGKSSLYPRIKRDAVLTYCVKEGLPVYKTQELLADYGLSLLGEADV